MSLITSDFAAKTKGFSALESKYDYEYLLKYKTLSYMHVQWITANEIGMMYVTICMNVLSWCCVWCNVQRP